MSREGEARQDRATRKNLTGDSTDQADSVTTAPAHIQAWVKLKVVAKIEVGTEHWFAPLPPPNRTGGSPASGSPVDGFTSERVDRPGHGR